VVEKGCAHDRHGVETDKGSAEHAP
jgi:hypothetical protein